MPNAAAMREQEETLEVNGLLYRESSESIETRKDRTARSLTFSASSETPVERWFGTEILVHADDAVNLRRAKRGAMPLLFNHLIDDPIGMVSDAWIEGKRLMVEADLFETARAEDIFRMVEGGLRNVSIGYRINVIEEDKNKEVFRVIDWEPYEASIVTVPADASVGIGRGSGMPYQVRMIRQRLPQAQERAETREEAMPDDKPKGAAATADPPEETQQKIDEVKAKTGLEVEAGRKRAIENFAKANQIADSVRDAWIEQGYDLEEVSKDLLRILEERGRLNPQPLSRLGLSQSETDRFSLIRAIKACANKSWQKDAPYELEVTKAIAQKLNRVADEYKFYVPYETLERRFNPAAIEQLRQQLGLTLRDLTVATGSAGGFLVETANVGFIEMLRNRSVAMRMGATRLTGLQGSVTIPRQSAAATANWLATEATAITESQQVFVQIALNPKSVGAYTEISRQLLLQSSPAAEGIVTQDLSIVVALAADLAALNGSGAAGQPTGIINTAGIGAVASGAIDYTKVLEFQEDVATANVMPAAGGYVTTPAVAKILMTKQRFASTDTPLWLGNLWDGTIAGFRGMSSNQVPAANLLFGDWSELVMAEWGVLEVEVNPYANFPAGIIGVRAIYSMDVGVRRPFAFSLATGVTA